MFMFKRIGENGIWREQGDPTCGDVEERSDEEVVRVAAISNEFATFTCALTTFTCSLLKR